MFSEIYKSCESGDIDYLKALVETSPILTNIIKLETNGSTALHVACSHGHANIVKLLLNEYNVDPYVVNNNGLTAYEEASNDEIRRLFHELERDKYRFSSDENCPNPFELSSESHWLHHYPNQAPILNEAFYEVLNQQGDGLQSIINCVKYLFGFDSHQKKIDQHSILIQPMIDKSFEFSRPQYSDACKLLQHYKKTGDIEYLLTLYTLNKSFCEYLGQDLRNTSYFYAPINMYLYTVENRAYKGRSYRGLTMNQKDFDEYKDAFKNKGFIKTKTFCSTSVNPSVAEFFADSGNTQDGRLKVKLTLNFDESCSTAIILYVCEPNLKSISHYDDEEEVLLLPGTIFSVTGIEKDDEKQLHKVYLKHYNTDKDKSDVAQDRLQSFVDSIILD